MPSRIAVSALATNVRTLVEEIALCYKIVAVAIDVNTNVGYLALVHNRLIHDPFDRITCDMSFEIRGDEQRLILDALRCQEAASAAA